MQHHLNQPANIEMRGSKPDGRSTQGHTPGKDLAEEGQNPFPNASALFTLPDHQDRLGVSYHPFPRARLAVPFT